MALSSKLFTDPGPGKDRLEKCSRLNEYNFYVGKPNLPGTQDAVARIQTALQKLGFTISGVDGIYGPSTANAVFAFKSAHRPNPILGPGQTIPDKIVGIQTIIALDIAMGGKPTPPGPPPAPPPKPKPAPPKPTPPPPLPKQTDLAWQFFLILKADTAGIITFKLQLTDPDTHQMVEFLTMKQDPINQSGTTVDSHRTGQLMFSQQVTFAEIENCFITVGLKPTGEGNRLLGTLTVSNVGQEKVTVPINTFANITGDALARPAGPFVVVSTLFSQ